MSDPPLSPGRKGADAAVYSRRQDMTTESVLISKTYNDAVFLPEQSFLGSHLGASLRRA